MYRLVLDKLFGLRVQRQPEGIRSVTDVQKVLVKAALIGGIALSRLYARRATDHSGGRDARAS